jgi:hypothetical protein
VLCGAGNARKLLTTCSFMAHPETLLPLTKIEDPIERFVAVTKFYLSGWHIKPPYANALPTILHKRQLM